LIDALCVGLYVVGNAAQASSERETSKRDYDLPTHNAVEKEEIKKIFLVS